MGKPKEKSPIPSSKKQSNQTTLSFTPQGQLSFILTKSPTAVKTSKKQQGKAQDKISQKGPPLEPHPAPLPPSYKPPKELNQYGAPLPQLDSSFIISEKLPYLDTLLKELKIKCARYKIDFAKVVEHYESLEYSESKLLISKFLRTPPPTEEYYKRLATEFRLIKKKQFTKVFLQVMEILKISDSLGIPHIIRGSAGSSLICYLLKITDIDPIAETISLARFMHTQRDDLPDIDIDFPSNRRDEIYEQIFKIYGTKVARISNHVKYSDKTALKQAMRNNGIRKFLPREFNLEDYVESADDRQKILIEAEKINGEFAHYSLHCGGIIIFDKPMPKEYILTTHQEGNSRMPAIQWQQVILNKDQVDDYQFIKIDVLSNRGLTELWDIDKRPIESYEPDTATYELLQRGENIGIVYAESRAMRKSLICIKPRTIQDIALALAIIRPIAREQKSAYFKDYEDYRKLSAANAEAVSNGNKPVQQCVRLADYLIYDDDAIENIRRLLKCSEADADIFRKAFAKGKRWKMNEFAMQLEKIHPEFDTEKRRLIYDQLCNLQAYSFCKSHAISYAKLVYALAYQKTHNPVEFWVSALNNCNSSYRKWVYFREAAAVGIGLTRGYGPWKWDQERGQIVSLNSRKIPIESGEEVDKTPEQVQVMEYFRLGYWCSEEFLAGMYLVKDSEPTIKKKKIKQENGTIGKVEERVYMWRFCGLISNYRCCKTWKKVFNASGETTSRERNITFCTIGYDNGKYIDIVLYGKINLGKCHVVEGHGIMQDVDNAAWIKVEKWKTKFL